MARRGAYGDSTAQARAPLLLLRFGQRRFKPGMTLAKPERVTDPIREIFGIPALELFASPALLVNHGSLDRFPNFMHAGLMASIETLCRDYVGNLEIANGSAADGVQVSVSGVHPSVLLRLGMTVYFSDLKRSIPVSREWLRRLETSLGLPECAALMAFANAPGSGLALHHDRYDQLLFQIRGEKQFRYAPNGYVEQPDLQFSPIGAAHADFAAHYRHGFPLTSEEVLNKPFETAHLKPGSAFFMPAGTWHTTAEQAGDSLSLVVAVRAPSQLDLLQNLLRYYAGQSPGWRSRGYGGWSGDPQVASATHAKLGALLEDLSERLRSLPAADAYDAWSVHGFTVGTQAECPRSSRFERFIRLPNSSLRFEDDPDLGKLRCAVRSGPTHRPQNETILAINPEARPVVEWVLATRSAFSGADVAARFSDFPPAEVEGLLGWLAHAALIRPLPTQEWTER